MSFYVNEMLLLCYFFLNIIFLNRICMNLQQNCIYLQKIIHNMI
jgi:hypothetical protein